MLQTDVHSLCLVNGGKVLWYPLRTNFTLLLMSVNCIVPLLRARAVQISRVVCIRLSAKIPSMTTMDSLPITVFAYRGRSDIDVCPSRKLDNGCPN
ncbi:hypothetical protein NPIL_344271 [Nephila pilipes]|uniref:Uncharacterized protein n=1 Tax=Nephila pilipes TaxID=299642 RepID=A0A8X6P3Q6_NEPPI|nr:hypothetical protein NPIL_344271 [Nephila pilipes]